MDFNPNKGVFFLGVTGLLVLTVCGIREPINQQKKVALDAQPLAAYVDSAVVTTPKPIETQILTEVSKPWTDEELRAISQTLSGECYDDKEHDKRLVCEVILNRVSDGRFGDSICEVITAKNQFFGYWNPLRAVSENDLVVAEQTLKDWFDNDCQALSPYLYFCAGKNRENTFYEDIEW